MLHMSYLLFGVCMLCLVVCPFLFLSPLHTRCKHELVLRFFFVGECQCIACVMHVLQFC